MVSSSLCPTSFIKFKSPVILVVMGQGPHGGQRLLSSRKERPYDTTERRGELGGSQMGMGGPPGKLGRPPRNQEWAQK